MSFHFHVKRQAIEKFLEEVAAAWQEQYPKQYEAFCRLVELESAHLIKPSGMTAGGHFLDYCKIPQDLYSFIKWQASKRLGIDDFFREKRNYQLLVRIWPRAKIKTHPKPFYRFQWEEKNQCPSRSPSVSSPKIVLPTSKNA